MIKSQVVNVFLSSKLKYIYYEKNENFKLRWKGIKNKENMFWNKISFCFTYKKF